MTGSYKLIENINYQSFLAIQGVGWALRKAADSANTTHHITHNLADDTFRLNIVGLVSSDVTYKINGPAKVNMIRHKRFSDQMTYLPEGDGIKVTKVNKEENYTIEVCRRLSKDRSRITMEQKCVFDDGRSEQAIQIFKRVA